MDNIISDLNKLDREIQTAKTKKATLEGRKVEQIKILESLGAKTTEQGKKLLVSLQKELKGLEDKIDSGYKTLREKYEW